MNRLEAMRKLFVSLKEVGLQEEEARAESKYTLSSILGCDIHAIYMQGELPFEEEAKLDEIVLRRSKGEPLAYILGERWFMGHLFKVSPAVLIPRQDTELLCEVAIHMIRERHYRRLLDVCTGSGCVAISIAMETNICVCASDISCEALLIAQENASTLGVDIGFFCSDLFTNVSGKYDIITANPPYISEEEYFTLDKDVRDYEPRNALVAPDRGLLLIKELISQARSYLNIGGALLCEIGCSQGADVQNLFLSGGYSDVQILKDIPGKDRVVKGYLRLG